MSPAMVELHSSHISPMLKPQQTNSQNPSSGQVFTSTSPSLFDQIAAGSMDRADHKPSTAPGLSKPRLVKVRRHLASPRVRSFTVSKGAPIVNPHDQAEAVHEKIYTWNPFVSEAGARVSESSTYQNYGNVESLNSQSKNFGNVFGSCVKNSSNLTQNLSESSIGVRAESFESVKSGTADFVFSAGAKDDGLGCKGIGKFNAGLFVFGSGVKGSSNRSRSSSVSSDEGLISQLPDELKKLNLESGKENALNEGIGNANGVGYMFGNGVKDEVRKMKFQSGSNEGFGKTMQDDHRSEGDKSTFVFGGGENKHNETIQNHDPSVFVFGSGVNKLPEEIKKGIERETTSTQSKRYEGVDFASGVFVFGKNSKTNSFSSQTSSVSCASSASGTASDFLDGIKKSDAQGFWNDFGFKHTGESDFVHKVDVGPGFVFGSSNNASVSFEGSAEDTLPDDMRKSSTYCCSKENLFTGLSQSLTFSISRKAKCTKLRKRRGKSRQSAPIGKLFISKENISLENSEPELLDDYSPMDYSPYQQYSRENSVASDEYINLASFRPADQHIPASMDQRGENMMASGVEREDMCIKDDNLNHVGLDEDGPRVSSERSFTDGFSFVDERTSVLGSGSLPSEHEDIGQRLEDHGKSNFTFAALPTDQGSPEASKQSYRRKSRMTTGRGSYNSTRGGKDPFVFPSLELFPVPSTFSHPSLLLDTSGISLPLEDENKAEKNRKDEANQEFRAPVEASVAAHEACEKWRLRGNQAYGNGYLSKAEKYYTRGLNSVSRNEASRSCLQALMLCRSNRAAARMSLGRMREAIVDCIMALAIDPNFLRARVRAGNCHLALGEIDDAFKHFKKCLESKNNVDCEQKILLEASEGLQKGQQIADCMNQSVELLRERTKDDTTKALQIISAALSISPHSESLIEMKAEALLLLRRYEEVIEICEQTLVLAEKNYAKIGDSEQSKDLESSGNQKISPERLWRWYLMSKSYFYQGKFQQALELLQKHEKVKPLEEKFGNKSLESSASLSVIIHELLTLKAAGNEAFEAGRHSEAVDHYTSALACNTGSRPFTAICFCNRAAAYQALGQIADAIADCSLAIALDSNYAKAISRRATLHEMIRDYGQAANDLNRLVSLYEKQREDKDSISGTPTRSTRNHNDLKRARLRLSIVEEEARKATTLDVYMILGIEPTGSAADVKKAYRKAALRHHPDKAGSFLTRSENVNDGLWREVASEVHDDSDRLFKMIGEAYTILSDPTKRLQYDEEEEMRTLMKNIYNGRSAPKTQADNYRKQYERSATRRHWREYGSSYQRW